MPSHGVFMHKEHFVAICRHQDPIGRNVGYSSDVEVVSETESFCNVRAVPLSLRCPLQPTSIWTLLNPPMRVKKTLTTDTHTAADLEFCGRGKQRELRQQRRLADARGLGVKGEI